MDVGLLHKSSNDIYLRHLGTNLASTQAHNTGKLDLNHSQEGAIYRNNLLYGYSQLNKTDLVPSFLPNGYTGGYGSTDIMGFGLGLQSYHQQQQQYNQHLQYEQYLQPQNFQTQPCVLNSYIPQQTKPMQQFNLASSQESLSSPKLSEISPQQQKQEHQEDQQKKIQIYQRRDNDDEKMIAADKLFSTSSWPASTCGLASTTASSLVSTSALCPISNGLFVSACALGSIEAITMSSSVSWPAHESLKLSNSISKVALGNLTASGSVSACALRSIETNEGVNTCALRSIAINESSGTDALRVSSQVTSLSTGALDTPAVDTEALTASPTSANVLGVSSTLNKAFDSNPYKDSQWNLSSFLCNLDDRKTPAGAKDETNNTQPLNPRLDISKCTGTVPHNTTSQYPMLPGTNICGFSNGFEQNYFNPLTPFHNHVNLPYSGSQMLPYPSLPNVPNDRHPVMSNYSFPSNWLYGSPSITAPCYKTSQPVQPTLHIFNSEFDLISSQSPSREVSSCDRKQSGVVSSHESSKTAISSDLERDLKTGQRKSVDKKKRATRKNIDAMGNCPTNSTVSAVTGGLLSPAERIEHSALHQGLRQLGGVPTADIQSKLDLLQSYPSQEELLQGAPLKLLSSESIPQQSVQYQHLSNQSVYDRDVVQQRVQYPDSPQQFLRKQNAHSYNDPSAQSKTLSTSGKSKAKSTSRGARKPRQTVPEEFKDEAYRVRRERNNLAAKRSRDIRIQEEVDAKKRMTTLQELNKELKEEIGRMQSEIAMYADILNRPD